MAVTVVVKRTFIDVEVDNGTARPRSRSAPPRSAKPSDVEALEPSTMVAVEPVAKVATEPPSKVKVKPPTDIANTHALWPFSQDSRFTKTKSSQVQNSH